MDIRDSIRKQFSKSKLTEANRWSPDSQPNLYELENFLKKSGYRLVDVIAHDSKKELLIEPVKPGHLYPEIVHDIDENEIFIKVIEHGLLIPSDVEEVTKGYITAVGVVNHINSLDLDKLEVEEED